jgi:hypothetical protein
VVDVVPLAREGADQRLADRGIVFDHQQARHGTDRTERAARRTYLRIARVCRILEFPGPALGRPAGTMDA